jgi:hypothetical protein
MVKGMEIAYEKAVAESAGGRFTMPFASSLSEKREGIPRAST